MKSNGYILEYYVKNAGQIGSMHSLSENNDTQETISSKAEYIFENKKEGPSLKSA